MDAIDDFNGKYRYLSNFSDHGFWFMGGGWLMQFRLELSMRGTV